MKKKIVTMLLTLTLLFTSIVPAFASSYVGGQVPGYSGVYTTGTISWSAYGGYGYATTSCNISAAYTNVEFNGTIRNANGTTSRFSYRNSGYQSCTTYSSSGAVGYVSLYATHKVTYGGSAWNGYTDR